MLTPAKEVSKPRPGAERDEGICRHHWCIEAPAGPISHGKCRLCGETQEFKNGIESTPRGEESRDSAPQEAIKVPVPSDESDDLDDE